MKKTVSQLWEDIFKDYNVLEKLKNNELYIITADEIRKYKEPRLMAKFDCYKQLPQIFKDNKLGILPVKNGEYIIGNFNIFKNISDKAFENIDIKKVDFPDFIETIDPDNIYSESNALNVAFLSGMLKDAFEEEIYETIQGKMRTGNFNFFIESLNSLNEIKVSGAAIEIDGGYESKTKVFIVEAKNSKRPDFVIRQLYYPYRHWSDKVLKEIVPVFFVYDSGLYTIYIYQFNDIYNYNSIELKTVKKYIVSNKNSERLKRKIFSDISLIEELSQDIVPFPQADSFSKVLYILELASSKIISAKLVAEELEFQERQGKYYIDALRYLNILKKSKQGEYTLTSFGKLLVNVDLKTRNFKIVEEILKHKPFYEVYKLYLENDKLPANEYIKDIVKKYILKLADETINRRSSTIKSWIQWIIGCQL